MIDLIVFLKKGMLKRSIDNRTMWLVNRYRLKELSVVRGFRRSSMRGLKDALVLNMQKLTRISYSRITMIHLFSHKQIKLLMKSALGSHLKVIHSNKLINSVMLICCFPKQRSHSP
jgi:hypothetical protein